jgi:hypothetical protein
MTSDLSRPSLVVSTRRRVDGRIFGPMAVRRHQVLVRAAERADAGDGDEGKAADARW